jgi:hypothetical protein
VPAPLSPLRWSEGGRVTRTSQASSVRTFAPGWRWNRKEEGEFGPGLVKRRHERPLAASGPVKNLISIHV